MKSNKHLFQRSNFSCAGCKDRCSDPNCHSTCERYLKAKEENESARKDNYNKSQVDFALRQLENDRYRRK